ncbi:hypothetical protein DBB36_20050 [Flavobacterium sp. WLB]|uniref:hypothetical protein n=1 Tax=unclassified Flavobacterium TaxID=196869 RepID=UPI0006ABE81F|nr:MULTISPECIES: hypothetical protein [unclassified Flavobacterium]KOP38059.1 hypothetical protein AKO67_12200 [Flavobacterium sp. VMW]OWU90729.1 hypothetical protein APR43_12170 [Flavobacterium sp. NLM]PUU68191.1 hypothetical protein DBB36_20050 [Flavobacterium sp. WLB]
MKEINEILKNYDEIIESPLNMLEANSFIKIYEGEFTISSDEIKIVVVGTIQYDWFPNSGANFRAKIVDKIDILKLYNNSLHIFIDGLEFGEGLITNVTLNNSIFIKGTLSQRAILGDQSIAVEKIVFSIPNMREFSGINIKKATRDKTWTGANRLKFENDKYLILIDKKLNYDNLKKELNEKGGYLILYDGELTCKKGSISYEDTKDILYCLDTFMTFINGRRTSAIFIHGIHDGAVIWQDFTNYDIDIYEFAQSWPEVHSIEGLNELFQKFSQIWKDKSDQDFLVSAIHWYIESNNNRGYSDGAIIMAQTALELLYNWFIVENKKLIIGKDSENINASNKIRLLLSQLNINYLVPQKFSFLQQFIDENTQMVDAPDAVVQIRNAIVHSQEEKRRKLSEIHFKVKYEALQLCIWYIEMSLLAILDYSGKYSNRCSNEMHISERVEYVPWKK